MTLRTYRWLLRLLWPLIVWSGYRRCRKAARRAADSQDERPIEHCLAARFGRHPGPFKQGGIWVHAVSVGETRSVFPLLNALHQRAPDCPLTLTSGSTQGAQQALRFAPVPIQHQMIPYDLPGPVNRFLDQVQPRLVLMVETEIWPNLYQACSERGIPLMLINARIKQRSFRAYQKWGGKLVRQALRQTEGIAAQFPVDRERLIALGADPEKVQTLGNLKFDLEIDPNLPQQAQDWREENGLDGRFVWVAASTHEGEEALMLEAHRRLRQQVPDALLILVPRHNDRFDEVAGLLTDTPSAIRSRQDLIKPATQVYLADTIGELLLWYAVADTAFVGGSLVAFGGHNILEPAALGKPVLSGPDYSNLQALYDTFRRDEAIQVVESPTQLGDTLTELAQTPDQRHRQGQKAHQCFQSQTGALPKLLALLAPWLSDNGPTKPPADTDQQHQ
ncbi:3-deoxy-D-manno-octulosonic acid transferase [Hydrogenovibrio halophilus]|uniref:3-deoxy-D-manno-octulosonic acid transferase n=1 Tax=Hydrogenovibrio halophilus TaxID=373391 RepID=UPI0003631EED|nr:3-deoxy-D-manno-octulosonic acid transferase [Hydrogenovibrio halophilus]